MNLPENTQDLISRYLLSKEAVAAFINPSQISNKRDLYPKLTKYIEDFLETKYTDEQIDYIEKLINKSSLIKQKSSPSSLLTKLKQLDPEGLRLLEINDEIDLNELKKLYRKASKKHHPDLGGSNETMKLVNEAYTTFYDFLTSHYFLNQDNKTKTVQSSVSSFDSWRFSCALTLAIMHADVFAVDHALKCLLLSQDLINTIPAKYASRFIKIIYINCDLTKTVKAAGRLKMPIEFDLSLGIIESFINIMYNYWVKIDSDDSRLDRSYYPTSETLKEEFGVKLVINHPLKAHHAYRLGSILKDKYNRIMQKYEEKEKAIKGFNTKAFSFYKENSVYMQQNEFEITNKSTISLVGFSETRLSHLTQDLQAEYIKTYRFAEHTNDYNKFLKIRCHELLLALFNDNSADNLEKIKIEVLFYCENPNEYQEEFKIVFNIIDYLETLSNAIRNELITIIKILDTDKTREWNPYIYITEDHAEQEQKVYQRIEPTKYFYNFLRQDIDDIYFYQVSGQRRR